MGNKAIIWLRRDLRLEDQFAFFKAQELNAEIFPIFIFDKTILSNFKAKEDKRISFIVDRIKFLNSRLLKYGVQINCFHGTPEQIITPLVGILKPSHLIAGAGYEPYDIARDNKIKKACEAHNVNFLIENDHLILPPDHIKKDDGTVYKVFTPYGRKLYSKITDDVAEEYKVKRFENWKVECPNSIEKFQLDLNNQEKTFAELGYIYTKYSPWKYNFQNKDVLTFSSKISSYKETRDLLAQDGTSMLSPYLRFGFISIRACLRIALNSRNASAWITELIWRDFYAMSLFAYPNMATEEMLPKFRDIKWEQDKKITAAFFNAETGYPIVDASIRQLKEIGWVHNRARMVAASFLTKHLLTDWRIGENFYSQYLMDYELASNAGGWQWAASTGFDAQPYFRIFNPYNQSKKFDPNGDYIRKYLPELKNVPTEHIHEPKKYCSDIKYPDPLVDHKIMRPFILKLFKQ